MLDPNTMPHDVPFYSHDERMEAFNHPAYKSNATFRAKVEARLALGMEMAPATRPTNVGNVKRTEIADSDPFRYAEQKKSLEKTYPDHFQKVADAVGRTQVQDLGGGATRVTAIPEKFAGQKAE